MLNILLVCIHLGKAIWYTCTHNITIINAAVTYTHYYVCTCIHWGKGPVSCCMCMCVCSIFLIQVWRLNLFLNACTYIRLQHLSYYMYTNSGVQIPMHVYTYIILCLAQFRIPLTQNIKHYGNSLANSSAMWECTTI